MKIALPPEVERALTEQARAQGTTPERLALDKLREQFVVSSEQQPEVEKDTLADFISEHIGRLHSSEHIPGGAHGSKNPGKKFAEGLLRKYREGRR